MKWNAYANDDDLAIELTPNFNNNAGGFLVDPNAPQQGQFGVAIGSGASRNTAYFARPSTGTWHHYAFVLDTTAAAAQQITPYVDGQAVAFTKSASGTGAGNFANSTLDFMSRNATGLFGNGLLDEVAVYDRALDAATIAAHFDSRPESASQRLLHGRAQPGARPGRASPSTPRPPPIPTARSPSTSGTSTATAPMRPTPGPRRRPAAPTPAPGTVTVGLRVTDNERRHRDHDEEPRRPQRQSDRGLRIGGPRHRRPRPLLAPGRADGNDPDRQHRQQRRDRAGRRDPGRPGPLAR